MGNEHVEFMETISKGPIVIQTLMVFMCAGFVVVLLSKKVNEVTQWLLMASVLSLIENAGYLLVIQSKNVSEASIGLKVEYFGVAYISTVFMFFVLAYYNKKVPTPIKVLLVGIDTSMILGVWFWEYIDIYYTSVEHRIVNGTVKMVLGRGILYYTGMCKMLLELLAGEVISIREWMKAKTRAMKRKYEIIIIALLVPNMSYVFLLTGYLKAYDTVPASIAISCGVLFLGVAYMNIFEDVYVAYADIVRQMKEPVVITNKEYCYIDANDSAKELVPQICELKHGDSIFDKQIVERSLAQKILNKEECELKINDRVFEISVNSVIEQNKQRGYYLILLDVTKERQQIMKMQELKEEADKANQAKTAFLSNMSHEIRTPINAIMGMNEMISRQSEKKEIQEYSQNIQFASSTLLSIVNDILDLSKIEVGKMELAEGEYRLQQLLYDCYALVSLRVADKGLEMIVKSNEKLPSVLYGDEFRIRQVILNLLTNAIKYTEKGTVTLEFDGHMIEDNMIQLQVSVKDTGIGVKEENIDKLFDTFQRLDLQKNKTIEGTGLGLAITKQLVELMGGTIEVESIYGVGSCFSFNVPQKIIDLQPMGEFHSVEESGQDKAPKYETSFEAPDATVLLGDDVDMTLVVIKCLLKETKLQIDTAKSGQECLQKAKEKQYDIIFMDHMMPEMDGLETLQRLMQMENCPNSDTPVIALTANAIAGMKEMYLQAGFADYLSKPVESTELEQLIIKYLPREKVNFTKEDNTEYGESMSIMEQLKQLMPEIDTEAGMKYCMDDESIYRIAIESYCEQDFSEKLAAFYEAKDLPNYQILIHGVKSSSLTIGLHDLSGQAKQLEQACKENNWGYVEEHHAEVYEKYVDVLDKLNRVI